HTASYMSRFSLLRSGAHRGLPSFPTRRSSDLLVHGADLGAGDLARGRPLADRAAAAHAARRRDDPRGHTGAAPQQEGDADHGWRDRKSTRLNSSHVSISYAVFCLKKKKTTLCI